MTGQPEYLRYLETAKQAEVAERLQADGFNIEREHEIGGVRFDMVARKGAQAIAYEFKSGPSPKTSRKSLEQLQRAASQAGLEFRIVVVIPPPRVHVEVENLTDQLFRYMTNESLPSELNSLSTHTQILDVADLEISDIHVGRSETRVVGEGIVNVRLQHGGGFEGMPSSSDAFPFSFRIALSPAGQLTSVEQLTVDTSTFYE